LQEMRLFLNLLAAETCLVASEHGAPVRNCLLSF
jgi:hypothetical protein